VEAARREAARVGGELAAVNQFLRNQIGSPQGAPSLADGLEVDPGYELALSAALDGRLRAAVVQKHEDATALLDRAGEVGGHALIADRQLGRSAASRTAAPPGAERLLDHVR
jgi:chromosome segregation protein